MKIIFMGTERISNKKKDLLLVDCFAWLKKRVAIFYLRENLKTSFLFHSLNQTDILRQNIAVVNFESWKN